MMMRNFIVLRLDLTAKYVNRGHLSSPGGFSPRNRSRSIFLPQIVVDPSEALRCSQQQSPKAAVWNPSVVYYYLSSNTEVDAKSPGQR